MTPISPLPDPTLCDREAIHAPGSIQPHGMMIVAEQDGSAVRHVAGEIEQRLGIASWRDLPLTALLGEALNAEIVALTRPDHVEGFMGQLRTRSGELLDVSAHLADRKVIVECEAALVPGILGALALNRLSASSARLARAVSLNGLCDRAAIEFRALTGFDRVMVYRFLADGSGAVVAEDRRAGTHSFLHQRFPAGDIPRQARALYVRNPIRVIPDVAYAPVALRPGWGGPAPLDLSDCSLRSVSSVHLQYLTNMGVRASASVSIVIEGVLWGLIACHHDSPRAIPYDLRAACCSLAGSLARQITARTEADGYRQRIRLQSDAGEVTALLGLEDPLEGLAPDALAAIGRMMDSDGVVVVRGAEYAGHGIRPPEAAVRDLVRWLLARGTNPVFATDALSGEYLPGLDHQGSGSGLLAVTLSRDRSWLVLWFRRESVETIDWAGDPNKPGGADPAGMLTPRASFAAWRETVRGQARAWTMPERDAARRLQLALLEVQQARHMRELNRQLTVIVREKDDLLQQKQFLIGEINHRVQNSLQLVSSFLSMQARDSADPHLHASLEEARRRLKAVSVVHRRLYRGDQVENVDAARYIGELYEETIAFMGREWAEHMAHDLTPVVIPTNLAVPLGLVLTELIINVNKHAYGGAPGPVSIRLTQQREHLCLVVADQGRGGAATGKGFGSRIVDGLMRQMGGTLTQTDNRPGLRTTIVVPLQPYAAPAPVGPLDPASDRVPAR